MFLLPSGFIAFEFRFAGVSFEARWANPVWEVFNLSTDSQNEQITSLVEAFVRSIPAKNVSWEVVLRDALQVSDSSLWTWAASGAWKRTFMLYIVKFGSLCASYWGCGFLGLAALAFLHISSQARQLLRNMFTTLSAIGWSACWPVRKLMEHMAWMWDWNFVVIPSSQRSLAAERFRRKASLPCTIVFCSLATCEGCCNKVPFF